MENEETLVLDQELMNKMIDDAHKYVFNLLDFEGEYTPERFKEEIEKCDKDSLFTTYKPLDMQTDLVTATQGYGYFGMNFIRALIDKDKDSAYHVMEALIQDWLDLQEFLRSVTSRLEESSNNLKDAKAASEEVSEESVETTTEE